MSLPEKIYLSDELAKKILGSNENSIGCSLDLNMTQGSCDRDALLALVGDDNLRKIARRKLVFIHEKGALRGLEIANGGYCKLVPAAGAPTIEIDGIQMHRTKNFDPFLDAKGKVEAVVRPGNAVLDTCGGLGYTAIWARRLGARTVVSCELDPRVIALRNENPWSAELGSPGIETRQCDVFEEIRKFRESEFDSIIHDPPRFSRAGELYGIEFYCALYRVLKAGGRLFHYTGNPYSKAGRRDFPAEVARRLKDAGFKEIKRMEELLGLCCAK